MRLLLQIGSLLAGGVVLCLLYKSERTRSWSLPLLAVALGFGALALPGVGLVAEVLAGHLVQTARRAAEQGTPFAVLAGVFALLWWASHRGWRNYLACSPGRRGMVLLSTVALGVVVAALLRIAPYVPDAVRVAGEGARAGWAATVQAALDAAARELASESANGGDARP